MRVFWSPDIVDRPYNRMYVRTIPLSVCMDRRSIYIPLSSQALLACHRKTCALGASSEEISPQVSPAGYYQGPELFQINELPVVSLRPKKYPPRTGRITT